jgi:hypothetical protein
MTRLGNERPRNRGSILGIGKSPTTGVSYQEVELAGL